VPQITHRDLFAFADDKVNLKKTEVDDQRAQVNRLRDRIESKIAASPGYGFGKARHAGSVAKGTALRSVNDRHLAVYVKAEKAPDGTPELVNWARGCRGREPGWAYEFAGKRAKLDGDFQSADSRQVDPSPRIALDDLRERIAAVRAAEHDAGTTVGVNGANRPGCTAVGTGPDRGCHLDREHLL
jgi:hypothetical protein